jgi:hypothetical protein
MRLYPHLAWFIRHNDHGEPWPYLWNRKDANVRFQVSYETCAEACEALGIDLENFIRSL